RLSNQDFLALKTFGLVTVLLGMFLLVYGTAAFRAALFPLLFLFFAVPLPEKLLATAVSLLLRGSAEFVAILFRVSGTPFYRDGAAFALAGVNIEVASQCSGIRSSLALVITVLLAGYLMLRSGWNRLVLVLVAVPMAMFKNAVRIVVLTLLAIHVEPGWLTSSRLHQRGGILFYLLALLLLVPVLWVLRRLEAREFSSKTLRR
ncbi:MAG: archaeosortase/exosortase family protein, partial [Acidobacteria bacterium]|nr:archaeosortase/exosortase family protein [Acidobacteriota bacterium]